MRAGLERRLAALEALKAESSKPQNRITEVQLIDPTTGEVGAVIPVGGDHKASAAGVVEALKFKHQTNPPRQLTSA